MLEELKGGGGGGERERGWKRDYNLKWTLHPIQKC